VAHANNRLSSCQIAIITLHSMHNCAQQPTRCAASFSVVCKAMSEGGTHRSTGSLPLCQVQRAAAENVPAGGGTHRSTASDASMASSLPLCQVQRTVVENMPAGGVSHRSSSDTVEQNSDGRNTDGDGMNNRKHPPPCRSPPPPPPTPHPGGGLLTASSPQGKRRAGLGRLIQGRKDLLTAQVERARD
jgi:hypothetical protein